MHIVIYSPHSIPLVKSTYHYKSYLELLSNSNKILINPFSTCSIHNDLKHSMIKTIYKIKLTLHISLAKDTFYNQGFIHISANCINTNDYGIFIKALYKAKNSK